MLFAFGVQPQFAQLSEKAFFFFYLFLLHLKHKFFLAISSTKSCLPSNSFIRVSGELQCENSVSKFPKITVLEQKKSDIFAIFEPNPSPVNMTRGVMQLLICFAAFRN